MSICRFCQDVGCLACEGEIIRHEKKVTAEIKNWKPLEGKMAEITEAIVNSLTPEECKVYLYAMTMPPKLFCWANGDEADRQAFLRVFGAVALQASFADGVTPEAMEAIYEKAERKRINQRIRRNPNIPRAKAIWKA